MLQHVGLGRPMSACRGGLGKLASITVNGYFKYALKRHILENHLWNYLYIYMPLFLYYIVLIGIFGHLQNSDDATHVKYILINKL